MGYVFNFNDAVLYEEWFNDPRNRFVVELEKRLMLDLLKPARGETLLEIGCGTGAGLLTFLDNGVQVTGLDPSPYMLDIASKNAGNRAAGETDEFRTGCDQDGTRRKRGAEGRRHPGEDENLTTKGS